MYWTQQEPRRIDQAEDLRIAPFRDAGASYGTPTWVWEVVVEGALSGIRAGRRPLN
ncbi:MULTISPECIES: hypothetical protein [unclassified Xanthomonas]|uniref:hypothetical protein n=1 Tax=Xanthomonas sp. LMG 8992 TaxID=1591157 RepID=UPI0016084588|nr:hypothetical protein [Xanthomonas sp. LMG 8992]